MLMAYLLTSHRISNTMSAYQLLRNSLNFLGKDIIYMDVSMELDVLYVSLSLLCHSIYRLDGEWNKPRQKSRLYSCEWSQYLCITVYSYKP